MKSSKASIEQGTHKPEKRPHGSTPNAHNSMPRKNEEWSVSKKMRLPHKVGLPLGSGGGGDDGGGY